MFVKTMTRACRFATLFGAMMPAKPQALLLVLFVVVTFSTVTAEEYHIGPGQTFDSPFEMPWHDLKAGDTVVIHWRAEPYKAKFALSVPASAGQPLTVRGEPGPGGELPVLDGKNAITPPTLRSWNEERAVIVIGQTTVPDQGPPSHVIVENLDITGAHPDNHFLGSDGLKRYTEAASAIYVASGSHITIRNCILRDCANGFFSAHQSSDVLVEGCHIHSNGLVDSYYQHNAYSAANGMTYQFNRIGHLAPGCTGNNLKDRSAGLIVRYNRIDGGNRQLDLVEAEDSNDLVNNPRYSRTYVYGNVLIERPDHGNNQMIHYGGDSGEEEIYRKGVLYLFNNTIISYRRDKTTLMKLSTRQESAQIRNNVIYTVGDGATFALMDDDGIATFEGNWIKAGWVESRGGRDWVGRVIARNNIEGLSPSFVDFGREDFRPAPGSPLIDAARPFTIGGDRTLPVDWEFAAPRGARKRRLKATLDIGAFEQRP